SYPAACGEPVLSISGRRYRNVRPPGSRFMVSLQRPWSPLSLCTWPSRCRTIDAPRRHPDLHRCLQVQIALREWNFDAMGVELSPNEKEYVALDIADAILGVVDPDAQLELDRAVTESEEQAHRCRFLEDARRFCGCLETKRTRLKYVGIVRDANR